MLALYGNSIIVFVFFSISAFGAAGEPVSCIYLDSRLSGIYIETASGLVLIKLCDLAELTGLRPVNEVAVVISLAVIQSREIGLDLLPG